MIQATIGERFQVVIPSSIRRQIKLRPRSKVLVDVEGDTVVLRPLKSVAALRGIGRDLREPGDATDYVRRLRKEWEHRL
jgi:AbrB family looped-hinge helix DNA binding protein